jgi:hypothetical protein
VRLTIPVPRRSLRAPTLRWSRILTTLLGAACSGSAASREDPLEFDHGELGVTALTSELVSAASVLGIPIDITVVDSFVLVTDLTGTPFLHIFSARAGTHLVSLGVRGEGPGEFGVAPILVGARSGERDVFLYDPMLQRFTVVRIGTDFDGGLARFVPDVPVLEPPIVLGVAHGPDHGFVVTKWEADSGIQVHLHDSTGQRRSSSRPIDFDDARLPRGQLAEGYTAVLCSDESRGRLALAYRYAGRVDLLESHHSVANRAKVPFAFQPHLEPNPVTRTLAFKSGASGVRRGYSDCVAAGDKVYALFWGRRRASRRDGWPEMPQSYVHVFDWGGELTEVLELDHGAIAIALADSGRMLYSLTRAESPGGIAVRRSRIPPSSPRQPALSRKESAQ